MGDILIGIGDKKVSMMTEMDMAAELRYTRPLRLIFLRDHKRRELNNQVKDMLLDAYDLE